MRITPRITVPLRTPVGNVYLGANIHPGQARAPRTNRAPYAPATQAQRVRQARPSVVQGGRRQPTVGDRLLVALAMVLAAILGLVAMVLVAMAMGVVPATPTNTATTVPTQSTTVTSTAPAHGVLARSSTGQ